LLDFFFFDEGNNDAFGVVDTFIPNISTEPSFVVDDADVDDIDDAVG